VKAALQQSRFGTTAKKAVNEVLRRFEGESQEALPGSVVRNHFDVIQALTDGDTLIEVVDNLTRMQDDDPWLTKAVKTVSAASPTSLAIAWQHFHDTPHDGLAEVFRKEHRLSLNCLKKGEFAEGIRALLIDKDLQPRWQYPTLVSIDPMWVDEFFLKTQTEDTQPEHRTYGE
jgi:enoyl-CoA hydratase/carnithine racemase